MKGGILMVLLVGTLMIGGLIGEIKCIAKAVNSDWGPETTYKREIIYTGAAFTGLGAIVGWFDIEDVPVKQ